MTGPNYVFEGTEEQKAYAAEQVHNRLRAETRLMNGKAALWYMGGAGALLALIGLGIGLFFWGYARYADVSHTAEKLADTLAHVLSKVSVETRGEVTVAEGQKVLLDANGQVVALQPGSMVAVQPGGTVALQPGGTVRVEGGSLVSNSTTTGNETFKPTQRQLYGSNPTPEQLKEVVEFTRFAKSQFGRGTVHTGWNYNSSRDDAPSYQYCYYLEKNADGGETKINIAANGALTTEFSDKVDVVQAAQYCRWFDGGRTKMSANSSSSSTPQQPFAPSSMAKPAAGASLSDWQNWCRSTYPATIQDWCLDTFSPEGLRKAQSVIFGPMRMDPIQRKAL